MKQKVIDALRWVGAVVFPILSAMLVGLAIILIGTKFYTDHGNVVIRGQTWGIIEDYFLKPFLEPYVIPVVAWHWAPRRKFFSAVIITGFYATLFAGIVLGGIFAGKTSTPALLELVGIPFGLLAGILWARHLETLEKIRSARRK